MAKGKFSQPRNTFTQETEVSRSLNNTPPQEPPVKAPGSPAPFAPIPEDIREEMAIEQAFLDVSETDDADHDLPPFLENLLAFISHNRKAVLVGACAVTLILLIGIICVFWFGSASDPYEGRILNNVTIAGVNVGGMTRAEAEAAIQAVTGSTYTRQDMVVELPDTTLRLSPDKTGARLDVKAAVKAAYNYGRTGSQAQQKQDYENSFTGNHTIGLLPYLELDEEYIWGVLNDYASQFSSTFTETTYELQGKMPALEMDKFDENAPCQTLVITIGTPGIGVDMEDLYNDILDAYSFHEFLVVGQGSGSEDLPADLDLQAIYDEFYIAPVDTTVDSSTFETIPGSYGYGFDMNTALALLRGAQYGDVVEIPMIYIDPAVTEENILFRDVLGECQTPHSYNPNRTNNLKLACAALNGLVLNPGETLSYNNTVGQRTKEKGYLPAPAYSGHDLVDSVGGGVCQVSSTLYYCSLLSDLEIVSRVNHGYSVNYIPLGMDATVNWGDPDFKFRNNTNYPIKIEAEVSDGYVKMRILGTDEKDYYVQMEYEVTGYADYETIYEEHGPDEGYYDGQVLVGGYNGSYVKTYRCKYDKETGKLISRDFEARSTYMGKDEVVVKIVEEETEPSTEPTEPSEETVPPTEPSEETTPSTEPSSPSTEPTSPTEKPTEVPSESTPPTSEPSGSTDASTPTGGTDTPAPDPTPSPDPAPDPAPTPDPPPAPDSGGSGEA